MTSRRTCWATRAHTPNAKVCRRCRLLDFDPLEQVATLQMRARRFRDGRIEADEERTMKEVFYFPNEVVLLLERAGFGRIEILSGYSGAPADRHAHPLVFVARRP